jgi:hypothetical protein
MEAGRHTADSYEKYPHCFDLAYAKMAEDDLQPKNMYNID